MTERPDSAPAPPPSRRRRWLFAALTAVLVLLALEAVAWAWTLLAGVSPGELRERRARVLVAGGVAGGVAVVDRDEPPPLLVTDAILPTIAADREILHPFLGYVFDPELDRREDRAARGELTIGELGFFSGPATARQGDVRVGVFGGSVAMLFAFQGGEALAARLAASEAFAGRRIAVESWALGGYKQPQQLLALTQLLALGERFDVVINLDGFNELAVAWFDNQRQGVAAWYPRAWRQRVADVPERREQLAMARLAAARRARRAAGRLGALPLVDRLALPNLGWWLADRGLAGLAAAAEDDVRRAMAGRSGYRESGPFAPASLDAFVAEQARLWAASSLHMHRLATADGAVYVHALQPSQYVPGSKPLGDAERRVAIDPASPYREAVVHGYPALRRAGRELAGRGVAFVDLTDVFADREEPVYVDTCCHLAPAANELLAARLADAVLAALTPPAGAPPRSPGAPGAL